MCTGGMRARERNRYRPGTAGADHKQCLPGSMPGTVSGDLLQPPPQVGLKKPQDKYG